MNNEIDTILTRLLVDWHRWQHRYRFGKGYPSTTPACRQSRTSRQYDDQNGALDAAVDDCVMEAVESAIDRIPQPWHTALCFEARNASSGVAVWLSPRLPADDVKRAHLVMDARARLVKELNFAGVM